jgi:hypothetical protein
MEEQPMKQWYLRLALASAFLVALMGLFGVVGSPQAHAASIQAAPSASRAETLIGRTSCNGRADLFQIYNNTGELCFANGGSTKVFIDRIYRVCSGDNAGVFITKNGASHPFGKAICINYPQTITITKITIS